MVTTIAEHKDHLEQTSRPISASYAIPPLQNPKVSSVSSNKSVLGYSLHDPKYLLIWCLAFLHVEGYLPLQPKRTCSTVSTAQSPIFAGASKPHH